MTTVQEVKNSQGEMILSQRKFQDSLREEPSSLRKKKKTKSEKKYENLQKMLENSDKFYTVCTRPRNLDKEGEFKSEAANVLKVMH